GDRFFAGVLGPTLPNRLFDLGLTETSWTSDAQPPANAVTGTTLLNQLEDAGIPWSYVYAGPRAAQIPLLVPAVADSACLTSRIVPMGQLAGLLSGPHAPAITYIDPSQDFPVSDHPPGNITLGEDWTVAVLNEIFTSPVANSSAVFFFDDENGGFWDPVVPPTRGAVGDGFRVPFIVISPWTPAGRISHERLDPASLLKFAEDNFGLPYLTPQITDSPSLIGFFNFSAPPRAPLLLPTPVTLTAN
ncbi:MAG: hypothetical protein L3K09_08830, partial [Thermoplasmata archaeon]|nr:hypothetical protein [Thermoplasmata archaeon]